MATNVKNNIQQTQSLNVYLNGQLLYDAYQKTLVNLLNNISDTKCTVWDKNLMDSMSMIASASLFKEKGTNEFYKLSKGQVPKVKSPCIIFFVRPEPSVLDLVAEFVDQCCDNIHKKKLHIYFVPNQSVNCMEKMKECGLHVKFDTVDILPFYVYPMNTNIFSMEEPLCFKELYIDSDITILMNIVKALRVLESLYGNMLSFKGIGQYSNLIIKIINDGQPQTPDRSSKAIHEVLLIDRNTDLLTPLMTQMTYEGLIDSNFGINNGTTTFNVSDPCSALQDDLGSSDSPNISSSNLMEANVKPKTVQLFSPNTLNNQTKIYNQLKSLNFSDVGTFLSKNTKALSKEIEESKNSTNVSEMKQFVNKLPQLNAIKLQLSTHTTIAELINQKINSNKFREVLYTELSFLESVNIDKVHPTIEKKISLLHPYEEVLKLVCLQSILGGGLKTRVYEYYCSAITQSYGYEKIDTIMKLSLAGLLCVRSTVTAPSLSSSLNSIYQCALTNLHLFSDNNETLETKPSLYSCFHGYLPLSTKLIQYLINPHQLEFKSKFFQDLLKMLPGPVNIPKSTENSLDNHTYKANVLNRGVSKNILVFFIGGCSFAELSALQYLFDSELPGYNLMMATTSIMNSSSLFRHIEEERYSIS